MSTTQKPRKEASDEMNTRRDAQPAHVFNVHSTALAASLLFIAAAVVAAAASTKHNHAKRHCRVVPYDWFPAAEPLHQKVNCSKKLQIENKIARQAREVAKEIDLFEKTEIIGTKRSEALPAQCLQS